MGLGRVARRLAPGSNRLGGHDGRIDILNFSDGTWQEISLERPLGLLFSIAWAADANGFFVTSWQNYSNDLLHVTLAGSRTADTERLSSRNREASAVPRRQVPGLSGRDDGQQRVDAGELLKQ